VAGYRRACAEMVSRRKDTWYFGASALLAEMCSFGPDAVDDLWQLVPLAERAAPDDSPRLLYLVALGGGLSRARRFALAVPCLEPARDDSQSVPVAWIYLAMAHHRLGHADEEKKWRDKAAAWIEQRDKPRPGGSALPLNLTALVLFKELEELDARDRDALAELNRATE